MMSESTEAKRTFAYAAQTVAGAPLAGTIESPSIEAAAEQLNALQLRITRLNAERAPQRHRISATDFALLNQQLAFLTRSNLPVEKGLRLLASEASKTRIAATLNALAADLEGGMTLDQAVERRQSQFPPVYAAIVRAGISSGSLPGALLNLNRHLELVTRLRAAIWRSVSYPLLLIVMLLGVLTFIGQYIAPQYNRMLSWHWEERTDTDARDHFAGAQCMPMVLLGLLGIALVAFAIWLVLRMFGPRGSGGDVALSVPLIGGILRQNLLARWCDALQLGVTGGIALPEAIRLAGQIVGSPLLQQDSDRLADQLGSGKTLDVAGAHARLLSPMILNTAQLASEKSELPHALGVLSNLHQQAAELRLNALQNTLLPLLLILVAAVMFFVILGLFQPMISLI